MKEATSINSTPVIRILKIGSCPTLSQGGTLEYNIGNDANEGISFRMTANSGGGWYSGSWVSLKAIQAAIDKASKPLTSFALMPLFAGTSINTQSFVWACLLAERLVQRDEENPRVYVSCPIEGFMSEMTTLINAGNDLKVPAKVTGKGVVKSNSKDVVPVLAAASKGKSKKA